MKFMKNGFASDGEIIENQYQGIEKIFLKWDVARSYVNTCEFMVHGMHYKKGLKWGCWCLTSSFDVKKPTYDVFVASFSAGTLVLILTEIR